MSQLTITQGYGNTGGASSLIPQGYASSVAAAATSPRISRRLMPLMLMILDEYAGSVEGSVQGEFYVDIAWKVDAGKLHYAAAGRPFWKSQDRLCWRADR